ncbi:MAG: flavodoxin family protein [Bacillota bacterium]|nr:flavodoxin family protein [Bacillota bacterium]
MVALIGSPRKNGSTARLVGELLKIAKEKGGSVIVYQLNDLNIGWCQSCHTCVKSSTVTCAIKDDANKILEDIADADGIIFGTPVYMSSMSGQMKTILDRLRPFTREDNSSKMMPGKKVVWAIAQRNPDSTRYLPVFEKVMFPMKFLGFSECRLLIASGTSDLEELLQQKEIFDKAREIGSWLAE